MALENLSFPKTSSRETIHVEMTSDEATDPQLPLKHVADDALTKFATISDAARASLSISHGNYTALIAPTQASVDNLVKIQDAVRSSYRALLVEPAIARVEAMSHGTVSTYYICRAAPVSGVPNLASYRSPVGRLAALNVGDELTLLNGTEFEVLTQARLRPVLKDVGWDSLNTVFESSAIGPITIESLRALLSEVSPDGTILDLVGELLAAEAKQANVFEGIRRSVITKMGLRDQPILDRFQDEIFRLPLDRRIFLLGPSGTGKTTTLIRRLGQKLDSAFLDDDEKRIVKATEDAQGIPHGSSWLMFTPTELLRQYLKEAFAREGVPASSFHIRTWDEYRRELARGAFGVLRTAAGRGTFIYQIDMSILDNDAIRNPIEWYQDFETWHAQAFRRELLDAVQQMEESRVAKLISLGSRLGTIVSRSSTNPIVSIFGELSGEAKEIAITAQGLKDSSDARVRNGLNLQLNKDKTFVDGLRAFLDELKSRETDVGGTDGDDLDDESDDENVASRTEREVAVNAYMQAVRAKARSVAVKRPIKNDSRNGRILEWIGERLPSETELELLGQSLVALSAVRRFVNPVKRFMDGVSRRYRGFRRLRQSEGRWYSQEGFRNQDIDPLELDGILLLLLKVGGELLSKTNVRMALDEPQWFALKPILASYRTQIVVDEATDFSPVQLACMAELTQRRIRSFFACGDFNQRLTLWGIRTEADLKWVLKGIETRRVEIVYRQSRQLHELARTMEALDSHHSSLPINVESEGVPPILLEAATHQSAVMWLASRIQEIEKFVGSLPSIAILVNSESRVASVARELNIALADSNIPVTACHEGQAVGQESNVRVFDIQHIKGLEFEAAFFLDIDELARTQPELFEKYLYVGVTRAATYLGITCTGKLPASLERVRTLFDADWSG